MTSNLKGSTKGSESLIDFDSLCIQSPYLTNLEDFLSEKNPNEALKYWLDEFSRLDNITTSDDIIIAIQDSIAALDQMINEQLNIIIHHPKFQKLEASWRGLNYLVEQPVNSQKVKIKFLDISWTEIVKDLSKAIEFDQSLLFQKIYSEEYGTPGGEPYGVLLGDYEISHRVSAKHPHDDISTLERMSEISAAAFSPFIASASSELFGLDSFTSLSLPLKLETIFNHKEYIKWRAFRSSSDSRFVGLTLPRVIQRPLYRSKPGNYKGIYFHEFSNTIDNNLWGNACYVFGGILLREFYNIGWFGHIRGVPRNQVGGGLITNLSPHHFETDKDNKIHKPLSEVIITDKLERELSELGFVPFCQCYDIPYAAFYSNQSAHKPPVYNNKEENVNAKLSSMLQHILCASRIAHYIKVIIRDKVGSFMSASECEVYLGKWLYKYTSGREDMDWEEQARFPLRDASVEVQEHPSKSGEYLCSIQLRPHYQLDQMVSDLKLVTELTQKT